VDYPLEMETSSRMLLQSKFNEKQHDDFNTFYISTNSDLKLNLDDDEHQMHLENEFDPEMLNMLKEGIELDESIERLEGSLSLIKNKSCLSDEEMNEIDGGETHYILKKNSSA
jgi:hypothetical protein